MSAITSNRKVTVAALALTLAAGFAAPAIAQGGAADGRYDAYLAQEAKAEQAKQLVRKEDGSATDANKSRDLSKYERSGAALDWKRDQHNRGR